MTNRHDEPDGEHMTDLPPFVRLMEMNDGYVVARALQLAAELGIADLLADGTRSAGDLAQATSTHPRALYRLLRALASVGVFTEVEPGRFGLTELGRCLRAGSAESARSWIAIDGLVTFRAFAEAGYSLRTGKPAFERAFGAPFFTYLEQNPELSAIFDAAMGDFSRQVSGAIVGTYAFGSARRIIDVGGGDGTLLVAILKAYPEATGVLFELPHVAEAARKPILDAGIADRCEIQSGDFFESVPPGGDVYLLKWIIHDWDDEHAVTILRNCRRAMDDGGRLLVVEQVLPPGDEPHPGKILDLVMLVAVGGQERTQAEYARLFAEGGFRLTRIIATNSPMSLIEAAPA